MRDLIFSDLRAGDACGDVGGDVVGDDDDVVVVVAGACVATLSACAFSNAAMIAAGDDAMRGSVADESLFANTATDASTSLCYTHTYTHTHTSSQVKTRQFMHIGMHNVRRESPLMAREAEAQARLSSDAACAVALS